MRFSGRIEEEDVNTAIQFIEAALQAEPRISAVMDLEKMEGFTARALARDARYSFSNLRRLGRFHRIGVISDTEWVRAVVRMEDWLFRNIDIRSFSPSEREQAVAWVSHDSEPAAAVPPIRIIPSTDPRVLAFEVDGHVDAEAVRVVINQFRPVFMSHDRVRILARIHSMSWDSGLVTDRSLLDFKSEALQRTERYAIVGGPGWVSTMAQLLQPVLKLDVRHFPPDREPEAWAWLEARPA